MRLRSRRHLDAIHHVVITVEDEPDALKRIAVLNTAFYKILSGTRLVRVVHADYEKGCIEALVEADRIVPDIAPAAVHVKIDAWPVRSAHDARRHHPPALAPS